MALNKMSGIDPKLVQKAYAKGQEMKKKKKKGSSCKK